MMDAGNYQAQMANPEELNYTSVTFCGSASEKRKGRCGISRCAERTPRISKVDLQRLSPCDRLVLSAWEQRHCCTMPEDLRNFYCSTDGFQLTWNYEFAGEIHPTGKMHINSLSDLRRLAGIKSTGDTDFPTLLDIEICNQQEAATPNFGVGCKIFELDHCDGMAKVCLVYMDQSDSPDTRMKEDPTIWLLDRCFEWHFLANTFTLYFRMMLVHQGLPQWQFCFTPMGLTPWAEQLFVQVAPHLLQGDGTTSNTAEWNDCQYNHLDPSVFRTSSNSRRRTETAKKTSS